jgi:methyltransferase
MKLDGYLLLLVILSGQRLWELRLSRRNARLLRERGAVEMAGSHYPLIVIMHLLFFAGILVEHFYLGRKAPDWWPIPFLCLVLVQWLRLWSIRSLGSFWNTRIFVVPGSRPQTTGPYRWLRHPNYVAVMLEFILIPILFGAYATMVWASIINALILFKIRIPAEENAWRVLGDQPLTRR